MTREEKELAIEELQGCIIAEEHGKDGKPNGNVTCELTKDTIDLAIKALEQEPKTGQYEKHIDHTDCIWYGNDSGCPVTCSQYRDGWNDAMDYIFKNGKGYQPYRHDG